MAAFNVPSQTADLANPSLQPSEPMPQNRQRQSRKRQIRAGMRSRAAAASQPTRRSERLPKPPTPRPIKPKASRPAGPTEDHVLDTAPQMEASLHSQHSMSALAARTDGTSGDTRQQAPTANQTMAATPVWWQWRVAQSFAACSATAVTGMLQLGQIWAAFLQASTRQSRAAAFGRTMRR